VLFDKQFLLVFSPSLSVFACEENKFRFIITWKYNFNSPLLFFLSILKQFVLNL
jgi:hypothetical protein